MKKIVLCLMLMVLIGRMPLADWNKIPDKGKAMQIIAQTFCNISECKAATVGVIETKTEAIFFGECVEPKVEVDYGIPMPNLPVQLFRGT